ncbi:hypothetical protein STENM223S_07137 [Streptomyces tendae]
MEHIPRQWPVVVRTDPVIQRYDDPRPLGLADEERGIIRIRLIASIPSDPRRRPTVIPYHQLRKNPVPLRRVLERHPDRQRGMRVCAGFTTQGRPPGLAYQRDPPGTVPGDAYAEPGRYVDTFSLRGLRTGHPADDKAFASRVEPQQPVRMPGPSSTG